FERFTGPCITNSAGKAIFDAVDAGPKLHPDIVPIKVGTNGYIEEAQPAGGGPSPSALYYLRRMQTMNDKKLSALDAMRYSASVGLTTHLDQGALPKAGPINPKQNLPNFDQYRMYDSWFAVRREGQAIIRLQMNLQIEGEGDPALVELKERLRN